MWPIIFRAGPITIYTFGVALAISLLAGSFLVWRQARKLGLSEEKTLDMLFLTVILSLIFGRLGYVYSHWGIFITDWSRIFLVVKYPGLSFDVSLVSGILISAVLAKNSNFSTLLVWDIFGLALVLASVFGFLGCFFDACVAGASPLTILVLAAVCLAWWAGLTFLSQVLSRSPSLAEISKRRGLFLLSYLIFQVTALGVLTRGLIYWLVLLALVIILIVRYYKLFLFFYDSISQRRTL